jgi:hypothetical protein
MEWFFIGAAVGIAFGLLRVTWNRERDWENYRHQLDSPEAWHRYND